MKISLCFILSLLSISVVLALPIPSTTHRLQPRSQTPHQQNEHKHSDLPHLQTTPPSLPHSSEDPETPDDNPSHRRTQSLPPYLTHPSEDPETPDPHSP